MREYWVLKCILCLSKKLFCDYQKEEYFTAIMTVIIIIIIVIITTIIIIDYQC